MGRGGGQVVSMLAFYSDDPSSNPTDVYNFSVKLLLKRTKINKKTPGLAYLFINGRLFSIFFRSFQTPIKLFDQINVKTSIQASSNT